MQCYFNTIGKEYDTSKKHKKGYERKDDRKKTCGFAKISEEKVLYTPCRTIHLKLLYMGVHPKQKY